MIVGGTGFHEVGLHYEAVPGDVFGAWFQTGEHFDKFAVAAAQLENGDFKEVAIIHKDHVPVAEGLQAAVPDHDGHFRFLDDHLGGHEQTRLPRHIGIRHFSAGHHRLSIFRADG